MIFLKTFVFLVMAGFSFSSFAICVDKGLRATKSNCEAVFGPDYFGYCVPIGTNDPYGFPEYTRFKCSIEVPLSCSSLSSRDADGLCISSCQTGVSKSLSVSRPSGQTVFYSGVGPTVSDAGCGYTCTAAGATNTINSSTGVTTSTYSCVSNGNDAPGNALVATSAPPETNLKAPPGCAIGKGTDGQMITSCIKPDGCGTLLGKEVCMDGINIKSADGNVLNPGSGKNCVKGQVDGKAKIVCATDVANATQSLTYQKSDGTEQTVYLNDKLKKDETQSVVTNPNGSTTTTNTTTNNLVGDNPVVTTTTQNPDGSKTSSQTGVTREDSNAANLDAIASNTSNTATNTKTLTDDFKAFKGVETDFAQGSNSGDFDTAQTNEKNSIISELGASTNQFAGLTFSTPGEWVSSMLPSSTNCAGSINQTVFGKQFIFAPCEKLQPLRDVLAWVFALLAILDILKITFRGNF
ncbi:MAG: hypothetical protein PHY54_17015 [Methylococcales bacterium]|nr:hypothetical protein [Methylococcales bacterium]